MQMSATLKIGHHCTSMKSTTPPRNQPGERNRRSTTLPSAPPTISPTAGVYSGLDWRPIDTSNPTTTSRATTPMIGPSPVPLEKAMPVLWARLSRSDPTRWSSWSTRWLTAQCFVSWSTSTTTAAITSAPRRWRIDVLGRSRPDRLPAPDPADLLLDQHRRPRDSLQALPRDRDPGDDRVAVRPGGHPLQRGVDLGDGLAGLRRQRQVALALDDHRVALAALVVELHVAHLTILDEGVGLVLEAAGLAREGGPLG